MTCAASSVGRSSRSTTVLRPIHTPRAMPNTITSTVATSVEAKVVMASDHRPVPTSRPTHTAVVTPVPQPPSTTAIPIRAAPTSHHGESVNSDWNGLSRPLVSVLRKALVMPDRLSCTHAVTLFAAFVMCVPVPPSPGNCAAHR